MAFNPNLDGWGRISPLELWTGILKNARSYKTFKNSSPENEFFYIKKNGTTNVSGVVFYCIFLIAEYQFRPLSSSHPPPPPPGLPPPLPNSRKGMIKWRLTYTGTCVDYSYFWPAQGRLVCQMETWKLSTTAGRQTGGVLWLWLPTVC
jgi:hypothetical protein